MLKAACDSVGSGQCKRGMEPFPDRFQRPDQNGSTSVNALYESTFSHSFMLRLNLMLKDLLSMDSLRVI